MWNIEFRPAAVGWMLAVLFVVGSVTLVVQRFGGGAREPIRIVTGQSDEALARADSIFRAAQARTSDPVFINSATAADFERLPGIGPVLAANILAYREQHGPFQSVEELDKVSGIGPKRIDAIRAMCALDSNEQLTSGGR